MSRAKPYSLNQLIGTFALVLSLLVTQFAGQLHRIEHAGWQSGANVQLALPALSGDDLGKNHSCLVFDASTLADTACVAFAALPFIAGTHLVAQWIAFLSWDAPVVHHFLSRGPPEIH
jgi:hypothetical protein